MGRGRVADLGAVPAVPAQQPVGVRAAFVEPKGARVEHDNSAGASRGRYAKQLLFLLYGSGAVYIRVQARCALEHFSRSEVPQAAAGCLTQSLAAC